MIAVTQPRRVAAVSLASRVAEEVGCNLGETVGYSVRFDEVTSASTKIKYVTDGMLVRELLGDPMLNRYSVIIVDEAHERTLRTDLLLAHLKTILAQRNTQDTKNRGKDVEHKRLKVVIMSATLDADKFTTFLGGAEVLYVKGRQYPVRILHAAQGVSDYVDAACRTFFQIHLDQPPGDVLIFMPGQSFYK
jgi:ATP-dependent RNA helicase DHX33